MNEREADDDGSRAVGWVAVAVLAGCGVLSALIESMLIPFYIGRVLVPVAVLLALVLNAVLPRLARRAVNSTGAAIAPFAGWLLVVLVLNGFPRPEGDVIYPGGKGYVPWVGFGVALGGAIAATVSIVLSIPPPKSRRPTSTSTRAPASR